MKAIHIFILFSTVAVILRCSNLNLAGPGGEGNGSETIARGVVVDNTGAPAAGVPVRLLPVDYDPVAYDELPVERQTFTDIKGEFRFDSIAAGTYNLEAGSSSTGQKTLVRGVGINGKRMEVIMDTCRLQKTGTILVQLTGITPRSGDYVYLPGTSSFTTMTAPRNKPY